MLGFTAVSEKPISSLGEAAAALSSIIALSFGYFESAPAPDFEDSYVPAIVEDAPVIDQGLIQYVFTDLEEADELPEFYLGLLTPDAAAPSGAETVILSAGYYAYRDEAPVEMYASTLSFVDQTTAPDLTQIPLPVVLDPELDAELEDSWVFVVFNYETDSPFTIDFPDHDDEIDGWVNEGFASLLFDDAPTPPPPDVLQSNFIEIRSFTERRRI